MPNAVKHQTPKKNKKRAEVKPQKKTSCFMSLSSNPQAGLPSRLCKNFINMEFNESLLMQRSNDVKLATEAEFKQWMTLHCEQCNTVLGDSLSVCGEVRFMDSIMCLRVTNDVVISDEMEIGHKGEMANCIYSSLKCGGCSCAVGKVIHSAPSHLAAIRSTYLLYKANISCYILNSCSMVKASTLTFDLKPLRENIYEVRQTFEALVDHTTRVKSRLADRSVASELNK